MQGERISPNRRTNAAPGDDDCVVNRARAGGSLQGVARTKQQTKAPTPKKRKRAPAKAPKGKGKGKGSGRPRKPVGRPSKIEQHVKVVDPKTKRSKTLTVGDAVVLILESGTTIETAAGAVGIGRSTVHDWIARGEEVRGLDASKLTAAQKTYLDFSDAVTRARESVVSLALAGVLAAGQADWRAFAWFLERSRPDDYGRRTRLDHGGVGGDGEKISLAELIARAAKDPSTADDADDPQP